MSGKNKYFDGPQQIVIDTYNADVIDEATSGHGVIVDSVTIKDGGFVLAGIGDLNGYELIIDADADTSITADTDDQIDFKLSGADDFQMTANTFTALSGSVIATNTINETTAATGVTIDGLLIKDGVMGTVPVISGDGAITIANSTVHLTKGSAAAITLAAPTAGTHDGIKIWVVTETAFAHVITGGVDGFNAKGSSGTITFTAAVGNAVLLEARNGHWWALCKTGVTVA